VNTGYRVLSGNNFNDMNRSTDTELVILPIANIRKEADSGCNNQAVRVDISCGKAKLHWLYVRATQTKKAGTSPALVIVA